MSLAGWFRVDNVMNSWIGLIEFRDHINTGDGILLRTRNSNTL